MTVWLFTSSIIAPVLFWVGYLYYKDQFQPEPLVNIGLAYIFGLLAGYACFKVYGLLTLIGIPADPSALMERSQSIFFLYCIGIVGVLEEIFKLIPFIIIVMTFKKFDEKRDGIIYASVVALGFSSFENLHYLVILRGFELFGRAIASPLTHTIFSSIWGYKIGIAKILKQPLFFPTVTGLILASFAHGLFDFLNMTPVLRIFSAFLILIIWIWRIRTIKKMDREK